VIWPIASRRAEVLAQIPRDQVQCLDRWQSLFDEVPDLWAWYPGFLQRADGRSQSTHNRSHFDFQHLGFVLVVEDVPCNVGRFLPRRLRFDFDEQFVSGFVPPEHDADAAVRAIEDKRATPAGGRKDLYFKLGQQLGIG